MQTECTQKSFEFHRVGRREVTARFDGGHITSDAGGLLLRQTDQVFRITEQFAECFTDYRCPDRLEHSVHDLVTQRVFGLALGYEDLNDHNDLRYDPLLAVLVGKPDPTGASRPRQRDKGKALAGSNTLNRLELTPPGAKQKSRYKKIVASCEKIERLFVDLFVQQHPTAPPRIVLDLDATDDPIHGNQLGRFFHGYYKSYCFMPLYIFAGHHLLCAKLRPSKIDGCAGSITELEKIVGRIREDWPNVEIVIRGDSGFCRDSIMNWCEQNRVEYILGLQKNTRLTRALGKELHDAEQLHKETKEAVRIFKDFEYRTKTSWSRSRRVIGKAEHLAKGANPRFIVTSYSTDRFDAATLYEKEYCARGDMENRIKEQQLYLFADRTSAESMRANQLRLWFSSLAYVLMQTLRDHGLKSTPLAKAQCNTIRLKMLKIGAVVKVTCRKVWVSLSESCPYKEIFEKTWTNLSLLEPIPLRC